MNTEAIIKEAAFRLLEEKTFESLTVEDILEVAHVSRSTFYRYFSNKYDLMYQYYKQKIDSAIALYKGVDNKQLAIESYRIITRHSRYMANVKNTEGSDSFWRFLHDITRDYYRSNYLARTRKSEMTAKEEVQLHYVVSGVTAVYRRYIEQPSPVLTEEEVAEAVFDMIPELFQAPEPTGDVLPVC